ncbi:TRAP transporter TatT component family protein [Roseateles sp. GG27B]
MQKIPPQQSVLLRLEMPGQRTAANPITNATVWRAGLAALLCLLCACSPRMLLVQGAANELARQNQASETDPLLARDAGAFYLKLSESLLREVPDNAALSEAVAGGFTQYAYAFVSAEADRIESKDSRAAQKLRLRAAALYERAQRHAMAALERQQPGFAVALASRDAAQWPRLNPAQIGLAYWAAASWGGRIANSKDNPDVVADLPLAIRLARLAWEQAPTHGDGALAGLMGSFEAARPGGSVQQASAYFDQAIAIGSGKNAGAFVAKAEGIALPAADRPAFDALLRQALIASLARADLQNAVMAERAQWLLDSADDLF